jgi:hypothetical protein
MVSDDGLYIAIIMGYDIGLYLPSVMVSHDELYLAIVLDYDGGL